MTPLRHRMIEDMQVRNLSPHTQRAYLETVARFARHFGRSPAVLGPEQIRAYQVYLTQERKLAPSSLGIALCGWPHDRDAVLGARVPVPGAARYLMTRTHVPRTAGITSRAWRGGTCVSPARGTPSNDGAYDVCTALAHPGSQRRSAAHAPVTTVTGPQPTSSATRTSIQSP